MEFEERTEQKIDLAVLFDNFLREAKRIWIFALAFIIVCAAALSVYGYASYTPIYEAESSFTVKVTNPLFSDITAYNSATAEQMAKTFPSILTSGVLQKKVMDKLGIAYMPPVTVSVMPNSTILTLTVRDSDPQRAYDVLNAVVEYYPEVAEFVVGFTKMVLLDESGVPTKPINSFGLKSCVVKGALIGIALWIVLVLIIALSKNTVYTEEQLKRILNFDCLGHIPSVKLTGKAVCPIVNRVHNHQGFREAVRILRLRVEKTMEERGSKVLLVSSAIPGEGKTTVSVNLAVSMAQKGKRVLLIDCDMRNPSVTKAISVNGGKSLADYFRGNAAVREIISMTAMDNLFVISGGNGVKADTAELLNRSSFSKLIKECKDAFDFVILDTPPCSMLADASEIAGEADCGLMVVRQDFASKDQILDGAIRLDDCDLPMIGCVLNVMSKRISGGYGYGYGYGYGGKK